MREINTSDGNRSLLSDILKPLIPYREIDFVWARGKYAMNLISWSARAVAWLDLLETKSRLRPTILRVTPGADKYSA